MNRKGFTLIELLVVVAVLALLASIVFSNLGGAREGAKISNALSFQSQTHSLLGSDLIGWWNFNEGDARDISGYGNNGTITGAIFTDGVPGTGGSALEFNGGNDRVAFGNPANTRITTAVTISAWINSNDISLSQNVVSRNGPYFLRVTNSTLRSGIYTGTWIFRNGTTVLSSNTWYHLTMTYNGASMKGYVNGQLDIDDVKTGELMSFSNLFIGYTTAGGEQAPFYGIIDDVRIYSRALTASEIQTLYAQTKDKYLANE